METILPILGVVIGWMLNQFSTVSETTSKDRKAKSRALSTLLFIHSEMERLFALERSIAKTKLPDEDREHLRQRIFERYTTPPEQIDRDFESAISTVAEYDPVLAIQFRVVRQLFDFYKGVKFNSISAMPELYAQATGMGRNASDTYLKLLETNIIRFAWSHSISVWFKVRQDIQKKRNQVQKADTSVSQLLNGFMNLAQEEAENIRKVEKQ